MAIQISDPIAEFAVSVVHYALLDAHNGDITARIWLTSEDAENFLDYVNLNVDFVKTWVKNGCHLENKILSRFNKNFIKPGEDW